jgi:hypothetical protein
MKGGGNITDISQFNGIELITSYWKNVNVQDGANEGEDYNSITYLNDVKYCFVGDVHGDLHQFLAPLVINNVISLTGEIETVDENIMYYVPKYQINEKQKCKVIYLGDISDEWIFSRTISYILYDLLKSRVILYIYGNHDVSIIGRYHLFKQRKLNLAEDIPPLWETVKKELNCIKEVKIYRDKILYENDESKGLDFLYKYLTPLFENLFKIFVEQLGKLSLAVKVKTRCGAGIREVLDETYIISHCTWSMNAIKQLLSKSRISDQARRGSDRDESQLEQVNVGYNPAPESINYLSSINGKSNIDYVKLSNSVNDIFNSQSRLYISKNGITYTRNTENIFVNQITGHSIGSAWRDINVNVGLSTYNNERIEKLKPTIINNKKIYYFDFGSSAGYDHDEISRPDYVYVNPTGMYVTNLPAFSFISSKSSSDSNIKDSMVIMKDKTPRSPNKIIWKK